jgi:hypothetical protein
MRFCRASNDTASAPIQLIESTIVQTATQNKSTDPKNSGAKINAVIVIQNWIDLIAPETPTAAGGSSR